MDRKKAWSHYFTTGDETPLIKAYMVSIRVIALDFPQEHEDMIQIGLMGLMKALRRLDRNRVKSLDAWVFLNVRSMMRNARKFKPCGSIEALEDLASFEELNNFKATVKLPATEDEEPNDMLDALPKREALIIRLIHLENYKRTEVAQMFGITSARIGQLEQQGLQRLKGILSAANTL